MAYDLVDAYLRGTSVSRGGVCSRAAVTPSPSACPGQANPTLSLATDRPDVEGRKRRIQQKHFEKKKTSPKTS